MQQLADLLKYGLALNPLLESSERVEIRWIGPNQNLCFSQRIKFPHVGHYLMEQFVYDIKEDQYYTLLKGKEKVLAEVSLNFTCYNLVRIVSIWGFDSVLEKLRGLLRHFLHNLIRTPLQGPV